MDKDDKKRETGSKHNKDRIQKQTQEVYKDKGIIIKMIIKIINLNQWVTEIIIYEQEKKNNKNRKIKIKENSNRNCMKMHG